VLIFRLLIATLWILLSACANTPARHEDAIAPVKPTGKVVPAQPKSPGKAIELSSIDPDVMYMVMTAEMAGQRGRYDIALEGYLEAAKRVNDPRLAERAAMIALYLKDTARTDEAVRLWLHEDKNNQSALKIAALSAMMSGDKKTAVEHLDALLTLDPAGFEKTALELLSMLQKEGKNEVLYDALNDLSIKYPRQADLFLVKSLLAVQMNNKRQAGLDIQKALSIQPDWDKALVLQAQIAVYSGEMNKAIADLEAAVARHPDDEKLSKLLAQLLIKSKNYQKAKQIYQQLIKIKPDDNENRFALALVHLQLEDYEQAEEILEGLLEQEQWQNQASFYMAKLEEGRGNTARALVWYDKVKDESLAVDAGMAAALLLAKDQQYQAAYDRLEMLINRYPKQKLRLIVTEAELLNQQKNYQKAFDLLSDALLLEPDDKSLLYTRALIADRIGKLDVLEADLNAILAKDPNNAEALNALGYTLVEKTQRYAEAEKYLSQALKLAPNEGVILDSYGWLQFKLGKLTLALDYLRQAYAKQPVSEIAAHLSEVLWSLGRKLEAQKLFDEAIRKAPEDEYLLEFKHRVLDKGTSR